MFSALDIATYFLSKDPERKLFNKELCVRNCRRFYEGNARLNKYLHIAQNIYIAKIGQPLFEESMYAYDNGAVVPEVQEKYAPLLASNRVSALPDDIKSFLDKIYMILENAPLDELIEISHEDPEWIAKKGYYAKKDQEMDSMAHADEYRIRYKDILKVMDRMPV